MEEHKQQIKNWKLKEVYHDFELIHLNATQFIEEKISEHNFPKKNNVIMNRSETFIDWEKMFNHHEVFFDFVGMEYSLKENIEKSKLAKSKFIILTYLQENIVIKLPFSIFLEDWEGFFSSMLYNGILFSDDYKLIMEVSRDYFLHSNFEIVNLTM
jgi:hypothetical protein